MARAARAPGVRQRPQPRVPAGAQGTRGGRRLLVVARDDARGGRAPDAATVRELYARTYREMRAAGFTAVGEFHYLGVETALAAAEAADGGRDRVRLPLRRRTRAVGSSACVSRPSPPTSARSSASRPQGSRSASPPTPSAPARATGWRSSAATPTARRSSLHVHADEQPREIDECLAEHGLRPIELLADCGCLGERTIVVHATHANGRRARPAARHRRSTICACPTTEADLGDGFLPAIRVRHRGIPLCIGSDSNVRIDPFEELRELEGIARRQSGTPRCLRDGRAVGDRRRERRAWRSASTSGPRSRSTSTTRRSTASTPGELRAALVAGCGADVVLGA